MEKKKLFAGRRGSRAAALQVLYQMDVRDLDADAALRLYGEVAGPVEVDRLFMEDLVHGVARHKKRLDSKIEEAAENWKISRMSIVDRNILRLATYEILYCDEIHPLVAIDEAVELAKAFGDVNSRSFINGILDKIYKSDASHSESSSLS
ncbi:MAG: transcription antitermination factor NusB [Deltaproteobacteria bacterium]|nr:transcription antitermination factor NusB [Deltaproteobacteria bacterium]MBW2068092.1 transcription antitermination factor NusB [Deltaproteobacteria bacterium]